MCSLCCIVCTYVYVHVLCMYDTIALCTYVCMYSICSTSIVIMSPNTVNSLHNSYCISAYYTDTSTATVHTYIRSLPAYTVPPEKMRYAYTVTMSFPLTPLLVDVYIHRPLHPTVTLVSSIVESGGVCGVNVECCTAPIGGLVHCEVRGGRYWLSSPIRPCQWLCGVICGAVYDCHTAGAIRREDVTHIGVLSNIVKDDGIVWYESVVATEDSPTCVCSNG